MEVIIVTFLAAAATVDVLTPRNKDVELVENRAGQIFDRTGFTFNLDFGVQILNGYASKFSYGYGGS